MGPLVLADSPMTAIIAELYFALGRNTKVILTRQDTHAHTQRRPIIEREHLYWITVACKSNPIPTMIALGLTLPPHAPPAFF